MTTFPPPGSANIAAGSSPRNPVPLSPASYAFLQRYIYNESGIVIDADKQYLLESRLLPVIREQGLESLDALSGALSRRSSQLLSRLVIDAMTTNETLFFRDPTMFEALRDQVIPGIIKGRRPGAKLRVWSAASSTGQEAYSMAMMLLDMGRTRLDVEIVGTDLSSQVLDRARSGKYVQFEINRGLPTPNLLKYFSRSGLDWQLKDEVRSMVRFEHFDLRRPVCHLGKFDLILCRNVLIYFDAKTKTGIVDQLRTALTAGGVLALGVAETVINVHNGFDRMVHGSMFYTAKESVPCKQI